MSRADAISTAGLTKVERPAVPTGVVPLISVAFMTALLFGPIVIATGFMTGHRSSDASFPGISENSLRRSFDLGLNASGLRAGMD